MDSSALAAHRSPGPRRLLFVITEDWFFVSHFLVLAEAARDQGFAVSVHLRNNDPRHVARIAAAGIRVIASDYDRATAGRRGDLRQIARFAALFRTERPDVVHIVSLRVVVLAGLAARLTGVPARVHALTGMGLLGAARGLRARLTQRGLGALLRHALGGRGAGFVFENRDDPRGLGFTQTDARLLVVGGAGIDPEIESPLPLPDGTPLRIAIVARMIHSKGIEVAVAALGLARQRGADVTLTLVGAIDPGNPRSLTEDRLRTFGALPGVEWVGPTRDVRAVWRTHHVACVPSLGGEGLPRSLLEAAAAGRAIVTTDTPGCATFVRPLQEGLVVPPGDVAALAEAFTRLAADRPLVASLGTAARARVLDGYTVSAVSTAMTGFYDALLSRR
ncbi:glycosyltransferase family 4 protein [Lichenihabitans sp. Uapishka_5]|uniref:glycosyltransferase family 4 protein n=1 Tax=Lichenihabitans sp. Uapishka_5 TaxID=3037302 RepID=UPI0029E800E8|nr:glycosyltransferase family 4 protein [Lichenihabitans sp. Uapishka_5]MDX7952281.1 glycosyltransferase family 4 protein [Lichenihabitans sp. Uapishka_5]